GTLRLTASVAFGQIGLVRLLPAFHAAFPRLRLELLLTDANLDLVQDRVDLAIRLAPSYRADVIGVKLFATRYRVVASPAYIEREGAPKAPTDLSTRSCVLFALPEFQSRWLFRRNKKTVDVPVDGTFVISNALALRQAALDGLGPALLADWLIGEDIAAGRLIDLFPAHEVAATSFETAAWLLYPSREYVPRKIRVTIDFLRQQLASRR
ncbi:MAG: substrate binding domain-containing protein, partial [Hyphomicrobiales bacterium]|nr:substrate binding domain-containing protein [Hyphomicrobiales bacterium]